MKKILAAVILAALVAFAAPALAASNPFADVPAGHWSYDAVALLASKGIISGYPDGQFKGGQLATRYEMASAVARAIVYLEEGKVSNSGASKEDLELVNKLGAEYKDELAASGVKVGSLDQRVAGLEKGLKGLRLKGIFWMDAEWGGTDVGPSTEGVSPDGTTPAFSFHRARFFIEKQVDANTFFQMRLNFKSIDGKDGGSVFRVDRLWFSTKLPWDIKGKFGYQTSDWDSEYGLYNAKFGGWGDEDSLWTNLKFMGFDFRKDFGPFDVDLYIGRNTQNIDKLGGKYDDQYYMTYGLKLGYKSEKMKLGLFGRYSKFDGNGGIDAGDAPSNALFSQANILNYGVYANYKLMAGLELKGTYNHQQFQGYDHCCKPGNGLRNRKNADYWQVALEADQSLLKLFSLWLQYGEISDGFIINENAFNQIGYAPVGHHELANFDPTNSGFLQTGFQWFKVALHRDFTKKLKAFVQYTYFRANTGTALRQAAKEKNNDLLVDDVWDAGIGIRYQYTPAIAFQLQYDIRDFGKGVTENGNITKDCMHGTDNVFRFRTELSF